METGQCLERDTGIGLFGIGAPTMSCSPCLADREFLLSEISEVAEVITISSGAIWWCLAKKTCGLSCKPGSYCCLGVNSLPDLSVIVPSVTGSHPSERELNWSHGDRTISLHWDISASSAWELSSSKVESRALAVSLGSSRALSQTPLGCLDTP